MHNKNNNKTQTYIQGLRPFSNSIPKTLKKHLRKGGYNYSNIVDNWTSIVNKNISDACYPVSVKMKKSMKDQYGEEEGKKIYFAKIRKLAMEGKYSSSVRATYGGKTETFPVEVYKKKSKQTKVAEGKGDPCWDTHKQVGMKKKGDRMVPNCVKEIYYEENGKGYGYTFEFYGENLQEAEYKGRKVKLNKIMQGDKKKFKVYVKNDKGNVVPVHFGQGGKAKGGTMRIRKSNPEARKSFRARHNCDNPGPRWKARYWSCKKW